MVIMNYLNYILFAIHISNMFGEKAKKNMCMDGG